MGVQGCRETRNCVVDHLSRGRRNDLEPVMFGQYNGMHVSLKFLPFFQHVQCRVGLAALPFEVCRFNFRCP